jgi:hypothetical protein
MVVASCTVLQKVMLSVSAQAIHRALLVQLIYIDRQALDDHLHPKHKLYELLDHPPHPSRFRRHILSLGEGTVLPGVTGVDGSDLAGSMLELESISQTRSEMPQHTRWRHRLSLPCGLPLWVRSDGLPGQA